MANSKELKYEDDILMSIKYVEFLFIDDLSKSVSSTKIKLCKWVDVRVG